MRITYVTQTRFPTEKAHGNQIAQVCHALAGLGHEVTLLAPTVGTEKGEETYAYYGIPKSFAVVHPGSFDALRSRFVPGKLGFAVGMWSYRRVLKTYLKSHPTDVLYARSHAVLPALLSTGIPVILEVHTLPNALRRRFVRLCRECAKVVCLTSLQKKTLVAWGVDGRKILVEADGVDLGRFGKLPPRDAMRVKWKIPEDAAVVGYAGSLVTRTTIEKGVPELIAALGKLKQEGKNVFGLIAGGPDSWVYDYGIQARKHGLTENDIRFLGHLPPTEIPGVIAAFDVCVYPAPASGKDFFQRDTSPLKLFEYLASGRPIVCADLPPLRDVVNDAIVRLCAPGDPGALARGISWVLDHPAKAADMAKRGKEIAGEHSWEQRMWRILQ